MSEITPDTKDWTWVLQQPCPECGFVAADLPGDEVPAVVAESLPRWVMALARPDARERPRPDVWSVLEYACHVRDVFRIFDERLHLMLDEDSPTFANWDQDATAVSERYGEQDPVVVSGELVEAGRTVAHSFATVPDDAWGRVGLRSNGSQFTVETLGQYFVHDLVHHLRDVDA
ncbi:DinB family protein [Actinotalea sp. M2MS4P-6]|uniref:DinB family protein n=1 Tax=Actinotalea sp. M2MS4P-6 TaxID=2983762 RepID=UPI0021E4C8E2|nr:DinB family protein [Actinotalea sp. M2MS4P-6]MCV2392941.1 DinB family protein [Actinotalea sp. M2MS4P-6]